MFLHIMYEITCVILGFKIYLNISYVQRIRTYLGCMKLIFSGLEKDKILFFISGSILNNILFTKIVFLILYKSNFLMIVELYFFFVVLQRDEEIGYVVQYRKKHFYVYIYMKIYIYKA